MNDPGAEPGDCTTQFSIGFWPVKDGPVESALPDYEVENRRNAERADVVGGPICESGEDFFWPKGALGCPLWPAASWVCTFRRRRRTAMAMSSNYNSRPRGAEGAGRRLRPQPSWFRPARKNVRQISWPHEIDL